MESKGTKSSNMHPQNTDLKQHTQICDEIIPKKKKKAYKHSGQQFRYEFATSRNNKYNLWTTRQDELYICNTAFTSVNLTTRKTLTNYMVFKEK